MKKEIILKFAKGLPGLLKKHSPELLTGIGIAGMVITTITAVRATPKALQLIDEREIKDGKRLTNGKIVKTTWKCYVPSALTGICSIGCLIGASAVNSKRNAALATAYAISMSDLDLYKKKALEVVGEKKETAIRDAVAKEKLDNAHFESKDIILTGRGETLCFEMLTNTPFKSDMETLRKAENTLNKRMRNEMKITVNEFLQEIGLESCDDSIGEGMGWDIDKGYIDLYFSSQLRNGVPFMTIGHHNPPQYLYVN